MEAEAIKQLVPQADVLLGRDANSRLLTAPPAPEVLHVASHGVFFEAANRPASGLVLAAAQTAGDGVDVLSGLARSALVLAGSDDSGGILTALEIMGQDLRNTQLVVLSACETARGDIRAGPSSRPVSKQSS